MSFKVKQETQGDKILLKFCGQIDEEASFPACESWPGPVVVDLAEVTAINSIGIRSWIMWFDGMKSTHFQFINCPRALVMQMNMVEGFLPPKVEVLTMEVPFFCEECDKEIEVLFEVGKQIQIEGGQVRLDYDPSTVCGAGCEVELDVNEAKFFRFLFNKSESQAA